METDLNPYKKALLKRLESRGIEPPVIPGFIRSLVNTFIISPDLNLFQVNEQLQFFGWEDFDLDYRTLELAIACLEVEGLEGSEIKSGRWFETHFSFQEHELKI